MYASVPIATTIWLVGKFAVLCHIRMPKRRCIMPDYEAMTATAEEARQLLTIYDEAVTRKK